jgi:hypothetical protein
MIPGVTLKQWYAVQFINDTLGFTFKPRTSGEVYDILSEHLTHAKQVKAKLKGVEDMRHAECKTCSKHTTGWCTEERPCNRDLTTMKPRYYIPKEQPVCPHADTCQCKCQHDECYEEYEDSVPCRHYMKTEDK